MFENVLKIMPSNFDREQDVRICLTLNQEKFLNFFIFIQLFLTSPNCRRWICAPWWLDQDVIAVLTSSSDAYRCPVRWSFNLGKELYSDGVSSGLYGGWSETVKTRHEMCADVLAVLCGRARSCWRDSVYEDKSRFYSVSKYRSRLLTLQAVSPTLMHSRYTPPYLRGKFRTLWQQKFKNVAPR